MLSYSDVTAPPSYFKKNLMRYDGLFDVEDASLVGTDVNRFIDRSKEFVATVQGKMVWVVDMNSLSNMVGHFGYSVVMPAVGRSPSGEVSDIPCVSTDGWKHPICLKSDIGVFNIRYETVLPGKDRFFKFVGMKISQIEEMDYGHSPAIVSHEEIFPKVADLETNKFKDVIMEIGKISNKLDAGLASLEDTARHIYI